MEVRSSKDYKQNEIKNVVAHNIANDDIATLIPNPKGGQFLYNATNGLFMWYDDVHSKWTGGAVGALRAKGSLDKDASPATDTVKIDLPTSDVEVGDSWFVVKVGTYKNGTQVCSVGDWFFCASVNNDGTNPVWNYVPAGNGTATFTFQYDVDHPNQTSWTFQNTLASRNVQYSVYKVVSLDGILHNQNIDCDIDITQTAITVSFGESLKTDEIFELDVSLG